jgi:hypothetical protein
VVAVGTIIADRPPHRTVRAALPHTAPTLEDWRAVLLLAHRAIPGTLNLRSVSDECGIKRCSPWPAPFSPQAPPKIALLCSSGSSIVWRGPTPPERARPPCGFGPSRTGLVPVWAEALQRSPGSRACCFSACAGSPTTQDRLLARDFRETAVLPSSYQERVGVLSLRFSKCVPTVAHTERGVYHFSPPCNLTRQREARNRAPAQPTAALKKQRSRISRAGIARERSASKWPGGSTC